MFTRSGNVCQLFLNGDYCPSVLGNKMFTRLANVSQSFFNMATHCPFVLGTKYCIIALQMVVKHLRLSVLSYSGPRRVFTYKNNLYINMIQ